MTIHWRGALLIALSIGSASATAKTQGHGKVSLGGEIVETPCNIAGDSLDQTVDFGLVSMSDAGRDAQPSLIGSRRHFAIRLVNCELASQIKPDFIYRAANLTFSGIADSQDPQWLAVQGEARGMAIELLTDASTPIPLGSDRRLSDRRRRQHAALWRPVAHSPRQGTGGRFQLIGQIYPVLSVAGFR